MSDSVKAARIVAYSAAVTAGFTLGEGWTISLPFIGIAFIEMIVFAHQAYSLFLGKVREEIVQEAAARAATQIENQRLVGRALESIQAAPGRLPPDVSEALAEGRLQLTVSDDKDRKDRDDDNR